MLLKNILLVAIGGAAGSVARFISNRYVSPLFANPFPLGTFLVNITGCFIIGILYGISVKHQLLTKEMQLLLMTGFCGGFTTFSAFTLEGMVLIQEQRLITFFLYFALSVIVGLAATFAGVWFTR